MRKVLVISCFCGVAASMALIAMVFITGQTFGQRCTAANKVGADFSRCVKRVAAGGSEFSE